MGKITYDSSREEVEDFILYHKYIASDENYGKEIENILVRAEDIVDSLSENEKVTSDLIHKLINLVGDQYNG
jgi:hypothetical protein